jgi:hypothetical protein
MRKRVISHHDYDKRYASPTVMRSPAVEKLAKTVMAFKNHPGPERRRSVCHDGFDASFDVHPIKRKLPLSTN